ncbi:cytochrome P450 [Paraburkholderia silviterrae]|uniref:Cytochrome P450 n=1 Tax=Paraburkholderia silviterrae TaxID=2528715 RepID=A0A4R5M197_9BURK|nr:cytochrome P450 [Paraburkholderia silviterrae]TDG18809.1 cytochrome P450 [Paraburkholderia silviterrae]
MLDPQPVYKELVARGPVVRARNAVGAEVYLVTHWAEGLAALNDPRIAKGAQHMQLALAKTGKSGPSSGFPISGAKAGNLLNTDAPEHTRLRSLVNLAFSPRRLEVLRAMIESRVDELIDAMRGRDAADLITDFAYPVGITVICTMLGVPEERRNDFRQWAAWAMTPGHSEQERGITLLQDYLAALIESKRASIPPGAAPDEQPDLLSAMIAARNEKDALSDDELRSMAYLLLIAGHETTVGLIGNTLLHLLRNPDQMALLRADAALVKQAVEETLRYDGSVHRTTFRVTIDDVTIGGTTIPRGSFVQVLIAALNRDPARFEDPDRFDITRSIKQHVAFGFGPHFCLGSHLARMETQTAVGRLVKAFPQLTLACEPEDIPWVSTVIRGAQSMPVSLGGPTSLPDTQ